MYVYKFSCYGTHYAASLRTVTIIAPSCDEAKRLLIEWLEKEDESFIDNAKALASCEEIAQALPGVIDFYRDSDY